MMRLSFGRPGANELLARQAVRYLKPQNQTQDAASREVSNPNKNENAGEVSRPRYYTWHGHGLRFFNAPVSKRESRRDSESRFLARSVGGGLRIRPTPTVITG